MKIINTNPVVWLNRLIDHKIFAFSLNDELGDAANKLPELIDKKLPIGVIVTVIELDTGQIVRIQETGVGIVIEDYDDKNEFLGLYHQKLRQIITNFDTEITPGENPAARRSGFKTSFSQDLANLKSIYKLSVSEMSRRFGVSRATIRRWLSGGSPRKKTRPGKSRILNNYKKELSKKETDSSLIYESRRIITPDTDATEREDETPKISLEVHPEI